MKNILFIILFSTFLSSQSIITTKDDFTGEITYSTENVGMFFKGDSGYYFTLNFKLITTKPSIDKDYPYLMIVRVDTKEWVFIEKGESLIFKIDEEMLPLTGDGSSGDRNIEHGSINEIAVYKLNYKQLSKLASGKEIKFRIIGNRQNITHEMPNKFFENIKLAFHKMPRLIDDKNRDKTLEEKESKEIPQNKQSHIDALNKEMDKKKIDAKWTMDNDDNLICTTNFTLMSESRTKSVSDGYSKDPSAEGLRNLWRKIGFKKVIIRTNKGKEFPFYL